MDVRTRISSTLTPGLIVQVVIAAAILIVLYLISLQNYLLFHSIVELAGIAVAFSIFILVWNTRKAITNNFFLIVGVSFLFIGTLDLVHTLAYKGMGVFPWATADLPTHSGLPPGTSRALHSLSRHFLSVDLSPGTEDMIQG